MFYEQKLTDTTPHMLNGQVIINIPQNIPWFTLLDGDKRPIITGAPFTNMD